MKWRRGPWETLCVVDFTRTHELELGADIPSPSSPLLFEKCQTLQLPCRERWTRRKGCKERKKTRRRVQAEVEVSTEKKVESRYMALDHPPPSLAGANVLNPFSPGRRSRAGLQRGDGGVR
ncbi:unnamed protein product [Pleuronectes platessa]|uniref:Uncharacterized protein n=1 Tax=Pleuronectes platessa TaxID=8262 RepID=A0A9N7TY19_PLEPL|nr:unnamed protein product [Pleuronectes platessa]